jgi:NADPH:quinone reductase-like Zn-dependent oxidoreductase
MVHGAWAEYAVAAAATLIPLPDSVPDDIGAQLIAMPLSTLALFDDLRVSAGEWIVQNAANGAVGRTLVAVAQRNGVRVINLVRREEAAKQLRAIGAHHVVVQDGDWAAKVRELTGGAPIVRAIDSVCDEQSLALNRLLAPGGEHVVFGALARRAFALDPSALIFGETRVRGFWALAWMTRATPAQKADVIGRCVALAAAGDLPLAVAGVYPLEKAADALREAERPGHAGKVLLAP